MPRTRLTQEARKAKTREALLAAATRLVAMRGMQATSLDQIALAAGFTKGAIYASFPNKQALFDALVDRHVVYVDPAPLVRPDLPLVDRLGLMGRAVGELAGRLPRETVLLDLEFRLELLRNPRSRRRWARLGAPLVDLPEKFAAVNAAQGVSSTLESGEILWLIGMLARGVLLASAENPGAVTPEAIEKAFRLLAGPEAPTTPSEPQVVKAQAARG